MAYLIDTNVFLWLCNDADAVPKETAELLATTKDTLFLSSISIWEVAQKYQSGKLPLPVPPSIFVSQAKQIYGFEILSFQESDSYRLTNLPPIHRDPFDRMLICQAIEHGLTIVTNDRAIMAYPIKTLW
jgi:PIN domain nuclease of toxin-antitoxin system